MGIAPQRELEVLIVGIFFIGLWESEKKLFWLFKPFSKVKTTFCNYWTSIKIKISMTCVYKEYKVKIKMVQEQWLQLKLKFLLGYNINIAADREGVNQNFVEVFLQVGRNAQIFGLWWGLPPPFSSEEIPAKDTSDFWLENKIFHKRLCVFIIISALSYLYFTRYHYINHWLAHL